MSANGNMNLTLHVWRQKSASQQGDFATFTNSASSAAMSTCAPMPSSSVVRLRRSCSSRSSSSGSATASSSSPTQSSAFKCSPPEALASKSST